MTDHINIPRIRGVEFLGPSKTAAERLKAHYPVQIEFTETFSIGTEGEPDIAVKIVGPRAEVIPAVSEFKKVRPDLSVSGRRLISVAVDRISKPL